MLKKPSPKNSSGKLSAGLPSVIPVERMDLKLSRNLLDLIQSGFKIGYHTEPAMLSMNETLKPAGTAAQSSVFILLDLLAAFGTANHPILRSTPSGITNSAWLEVYISWHSFKVSMLGQLSAILD